MTSQVTADPIPSATVIVSESGLTSVADETGSAILRGLAPGRYELRVSALGYEARTVETRAMNGRRVQVEVALVPDPLKLPNLEIPALSGGMSEGGIQVVPEELGPAHQDLPAALETVPGLTVVRRGGPGAPSRIQLRGAESDQVLVLLDGVPLNSPLTGEVDLSTVDLASLSRVVVLPGARSDRYGGRALGGVILLESRRSKESTASLTVGAGAWESQRMSGRVSWVPSSSWDVSFGGQWRGAKGDFLYDVPAFRGGGEARRVNSRFHRGGGHMGLGYAGSLGEVSLRLHGSRIHRGSPGTIAQPSRSGRQEHDRHGGSLRADVGDRAAGASLLLGLQWQRAEYRDSAPPSGPAYHQVARVAQRDLSAEGWKAMGPVVIRGGAELRSLRVRSRELIPPSSTTGEVALWARGEISHRLGRSARGEIQAGLRLDRHDRVDGTEASPGVMVTLLREGTELEVAFRSAFAPPGLSDLFFQEGVRVRPNPDLRPERVRGEWSAILSQTLHLTEIRLDGRVSAYRSDIDDMILWLPDFRSIWSPDNVDVTRRGVEGELRAELPALGGTHSVSGQVAWSRVAYRGGVLSGQVVYRPRITGHVEGRLDLPLGEVTVGANHVGARRAVPGSDLNALGPYTTIDLGLGLPLSLGPVDGLLDLSLTNLLDERAALLVDYPLPGRGWSARLHLEPNVNSSNAN